LDEEGGKSERAKRMKAREGLKDALIDGGGSTTSVGEKEEMRDETNVRRAR
tara:strand:+ start:2843 stop:2995 length:153 start_codon:yes stop_codon:yes gene_type:complete